MLSILFYHKNLRNNTYYHITDICFGLYILITYIYNIKYNEKLVDITTIEQ